MTPSDCVGGIRHTRVALRPEMDPSGPTPEAWAACIRLNTGMGLLCLDASSTPEVVRPKGYGRQVRSTTLGVETLILASRIIWSRSTVATINWTPATT